MRAWVRYVLAMVPLTLIEACEANSPTPTDDCDGERARCIGAAPVLEPVHEPATDVLDFVALALGLGALEEDCSPLPACPAGGGTLEAECIRSGGSSVALSWTCAGTLPTSATVAYPSGLTATYDAVYDASALVRVLGPTSTDGWRRAIDYTYDVGDAPPIAVQETYVEADDETTLFYCERRTLRFDDAPRVAAYREESLCNGDVFVEYFYFHEPAPSGAERLVRTDIDLNGDGAIDQTQTYEYDDDDRLAYIYQGDERGATKVRIGSCDEECDIPIDEDDFTLHFAPERF